MATTTLKTADELLQFQLRTALTMEDDSLMALGVLAGDPDDIAAAFTKNGGSVGTAVDGKQAVIDPEGHAWLITSAR